LPPSWQPSIAVYLENGYVREDRLETPLFNAQTATIANTLANFFVFGVLPPLQKHALAGLAIAKTLPEP
jgi:hypothetical protein